MHLLTSYIDPFLNSLGKVAFVINERRVWQHLSPNWQQLTGFTVADTLGTSADDFLSFADCPVIQEVISDLLAGIREQASYVARCITAYGDVRYVELDMAAHLAQGGQDGEMVIVGLMHDVTERKQAEDALVRSEQRTQQIVDNIPSMVSYLSPDLRITFANTAYAAHFDKRVDEVIGKSLFALLHPSQHAQARDHLTSLSKHNPQCVFEHWVIRANGEQRFQRWTDRVFFDDDGHISEYQSVGVDLTDRKLAEDALQQSESKFRALVENVGDIIFTLDLEGNFTYLSPSFERVIGYPSEKVWGLSGLTIIHPADIDTVQANIHKVLSGSAHTESVFYRVEHAGGEWHWHAGRGAPIVDDAGKVTGMAAISREVHKIRENQLLLNSSLEQLEQALEDKQMLMKEIHHRVKNNLQIVASLLSIQARQVGDAHAKDALSASRDRVIAIAGIHNLMYQGDSSDTVVFGAYLQTLIERIQRAFAASDVTFEVNSDNLELPVNQAVPLALIVNELLTNAVKYAFAWPQGDARVNVRLADDYDSITMIVEDNGVGMPADTDPLNSDSLGMTIVQSLTSQLDGTVAFTNREDRSGLRVVVNVPSSEQ